ncbi:antitoxin Xre/MbcA/ParS toxin-binding domain-containing protein [Reichenbachiella sp. MALMAid0571]|uniref:type II RES/Xre toxin-antitoxin system antitoxin n=1 Tax=Reichenbachiella sp. MALMAid0571 TaxID=3143939 RepID=UPI0032DE30BE
MDEFDSIVNEPAVRYHKANDGITKADFLSIAAMTGMNLTEFSSLLPVSKRTIEKVKDQELLSPQVSDRVLQIGTLFQYGTDVFEDAASFQAWLHTSLIALGGKKPVSLMNNDTGISIVRDLLGRIEHGVYS